MDYWIIKQYKMPDRQRCGSVKSYNLLLKIGQEPSGLASRTCLSNRYNRHLLA